MKTVIPFLCLLVFSITSWANVNIDPKADALGGAGLAYVNPTASVQINPAAIGFLDKYFIGLQSLKGKATQGVDFDQHTVLLADATSKGFAKGSLLYKYRKYDTAAGRVREDLIQASLSKKITQRIAMAVMGYRLKTDFQYNQADYDQINADLYAFIQLSDKWSMGLAQKSLLGVEEEASFTPSILVPSTGVGLNWHPSDLIQVLFDIYQWHDRNPNSYRSHHLGVELSMISDWFLRVGYQIDDIVGENRYSAGLGWAGPRLRFNYSYSSEVRREYGDSHNIDFVVNL